MVNGKVSLSLIGCCAIRDIFGLHDDDAGYVINKYVQCVSPVSAVTKSPLQRMITESDKVLFDGTNNFFGKCQRLELEKNVFEYMAEEQSDYLIVDAAEFRRKLFYFPDSDGWFSENYNLSHMFESYIEAGLLPSKYRVQDPLKFESGQRYDLLKRYCDRLTDMYSPDRIILVEIRAGGHLIIDDQVRCDAEKKTADIFNERLDYAFGVMKEYLKGTHVICFPTNVSIDPDHKWGRNLLHYRKAYYDYALEAVDLITSKQLSKDEEIKSIEELKEKCEERLHEESNNLWYI